MDRADARRGARADRINAAQSPYGNKQSRKKQPKVEKGGLWSFIKSWSFFGPDEDSNMTNDSDSDDDMPDQQPTKYYPKTPMKYSGPSNIKRSDDESGSSHVASGSSVSSYDDDLRRYKVPGDIWRLPTPAPLPKPIAPPLAKVTRIGGQPQRITATAAVPSQSSSLDAPSTTSAPVPSNLGDIRTLVPAQVARFLLNKAGTPLTSEEFEQIRKILRLAVDKDASDGDLSLLESTLETAERQMAEIAEKEQAPPEAPNMGTVVTRNPNDDDELLEEDREGSKNSSDSTQKVSDSGSDHYSSPSIATNGLPPFQPPDEDEDQSPPEPEPKQAEIDEAEHLRCLLDEKTEELRRYLNLDQDEDEDAQAWEELERWKGLKSPTPSAAGSVSDVTTSATSSSGTSRGEEEEEEQLIKVPEDPLDYNKGYTPAELMVNPYDRISAFRNRKTRRKLVSLEDLAIIRKKRAAAKEEAAKLAKAALEREEAEKADAARAAAERRAIEEAMESPPVPQRQEFTMGILNALNPRGSGGDVYNVLPYEKEPTEDPPTTGNWLTTGKTKSGKTWNSVEKKRKANYLFIESNGELLDPPTEGPPTKRRRSTSPNEDVESDQHLEGAMIITADGQIEDTPIRQLEEDQDDDNDDDMVDETPEPPPPPPAVLTRASPARRKPRPKLRPVPDATRPKHFQYSPITPSPLRMVSAFDSPKQASVEIPPEAVPPKEEAPVKDEESYAFSIFTYRLGSIGPMRASREVIQRATDCNPYHLPEYTMGSGKYTARYGRGFKRRTPKIFRRARNTHAVGKVQQVPISSEHTLATMLEEGDIHTIEPSTVPSLEPEMISMNIEEEFHTNGTSEPTKGSSTSSVIDMIPEVELSSEPSKRKSAVTTSTSSSDPLIHSRSGATNSMSDDIPPLRLPGVPPRKVRAPRLMPGPDATTRRYDWAAAGIRPAHGVTAPSGSE